MDSSLQTTKNWLAKIGKAFFGGRKKCIYIFWMVVCCTLLQNLCLLDWCSESLSRIKILAHAVDVFLYHCLQKVSSKDLQLVWEYRPILSTKRFTSSSDKLAPILQPSCTRIKVVYGVLYSSSHRPIIFVHLVIKSFFVSNCMIMI